MSQKPPALLDRLARYGQDHLLQWWDTLEQNQQDQLSRQLESLDLELLKSVWQREGCADQQGAEPNNKATGTATAETKNDRIESATAPQTLVRQPQTPDEQAQWVAAAVVGNQLLAEGKVAVITVAGGQGTRLGFDHPKGMFPIGPVSDRTLFQIFAEQILARRRRHQAPLLWLIMTSDATHEETVQFFEEHQYFQLGRETVSFVPQGSLPALDAASGRILMSDRHSVALSPDGHGGLIGALKKSGSLKRMAKQGIEHLFYHQVDNPTVIICDPALLGFHLQYGSSMTTNVVRKVSPTERMGVLVDVAGRTEIIEYSELTEQQASRLDANGEWIFWAGNTAIHVFSCDFLRTLAEGEGRLPLHAARKKVPHLNEAGQLVEPDESAGPNGIKLERFIFDALPLAPKTLVVEGNRDREFNPVKNRDGADSPETSQAALSRLGREWLAAAGVAVKESESVEISPLLALDREEFSRQIEEKMNLADAVLRSDG